MTRWCFYCQSPIGSGSQRKGWLWLHENCCEKLLNNASDYVALRNKIKNGEMKDLDSVKQFMEQMDKFAKKMEASKKIIDAYLNHQNINAR